MTPPEPAPGDVAPGALDGLLVLSIEQAVAAPLATCRLADAGARVIKVERSTGDFARHYDDFAGGLSSYFAWLNRGKESLVADIKNPQDRELLLAIAGEADVFVQNLAPGAAERAGLGSEELFRRNPRLTTCDISGYSSHGPFRARRAYDLLVQAESGLAEITGTPDGPGRVGVSVCDIATGMTAHASILEALFERQRTGEGRRLEVSLFDSMAEWMSVPLLGWEGADMKWPREGLRHPTIAPYGVFALARNDRILLAIQNDREFARLVSALGHAEMADDADFRTNPDRIAHRADLDARIGSVLRGWTREVATRKLEEAKVAYGFVSTLEDLSRHPHLRRIDVPTPDGSLSMPAPATVARGRRPAGGAIPTLGEHSDRVRAEFGREFGGGRGRERGQERESE